MIKVFSTGPLLGLLIVFSVMSPAIASRRPSRLRPLNPCNVTVITDGSSGRTVVSNGGVVIINRGSGHNSSITRVEQNCLVNTRRIRAETPSCGLNQYSQPRVGEFRRSEWRRNGRVVYSETNLVRCF